MRRKRIEAAPAVRIAGRVARAAEGVLEIVERGERRRVVLDAQVVIEGGAPRPGAHVVVDALPAQRLRQESLYREPSQERVLEATHIVVGRPRRVVLAGTLLAAAAIGALAWPRTPTAQELTAPRCPAGTRRTTAPAHDGGWIHFCLTHDSVREGPYSRWSARGVKLEERSYRQGRLEGELRSWHPSGKLARQTRYAGGQRHGLSREWHPDGSDAALGEYRRGQQHGVWLWRSPAGRLERAVFADGWPVSTRCTD